MTEKTILTQDQIDLLLEGVLRASGSRLGNYTYQKTLDELRSSIRAIEQAVLQSDQVQAWKRDAERYQWLRSSDHAEVRVFSPFHGSLSRDLAVEHLDSTVDAAMEKQT